VRLKTYRSARELLSQVEQTLAANQPSFHHSPLDDIIDALCRGRHYSWVGLYLAVGEKDQHLLSASGESGLTAITQPETRSKILVSLKLASRELGVLAVESDRETAFSPEERVFVEKVAALLARFLAGPGQYLVRKAREKAATTDAVPARGPQSVSQPSSSPSRTASAAVGEK
jgi:hypothetical protein